MIRTIRTDQLLPGMYVVNLSKGWLNHGFWRSRFMVKDAEMIRRIRAEGIEEVHIDTRRGRDLPDRMPLEGLNRNQLKPDGEKSIILPATAEPARPLAQVSVEEERRRAALLLQGATSTVRELMTEARRGNSVEAERMAPYIDKMIDSIARNGDALVPLTRVKQRLYLYEHPVATAALMVAVALRQDMDRDLIYGLAMGSLLQDIGQAKLDANLISRRGALSPSELQLVQNHVEESLHLIDAVPNLPDESRLVVQEHHERYDGSGYPHRLSGEQISLAGRLAAIVDSYDAMTSERPYRHALSPALALRDLYQQGGNRMDLSLVQSLIRTLGIYPIGTLVRLESNHLAVVLEQNSDDLLRPVVRVIYDINRSLYVSPVRMDLSRKTGNNFGGIVAIEEYRRWGILPTAFEPA
ncbi:MAG: hypothetical protein RIR00_2308 [Pseudomonadota bacterium]|jgi:HD-GYP domain-containing protein (c-di-GMP phosphodiesterase class II)